VDSVLASGLTYEVSKGYYLTGLGTVGIVIMSRRLQQTTGRRAPKLSYQADPIRESLKILGRKWTLLILRDVAFLKLRRFGEVRRNNPGLTARVLSRRLSQMRDEGLLKRREDGKAVYYDLTGTG